MTPVGYISLRDSGGNWWQVSVAADGHILASRTPSGNPATYILVDAATGTTYWKLNVQTDGRIFTTASSPSAPIGSIILRSPSNTYFDLRVDNSGRLYTVPSTYSDIPAVPGCGLAYQLLDSLGRGWKLDLDSNLLLRLVFVSMNSGLPLLLASYDESPIAYRVDVNISGLVFTSVVPYSSSIPKFVPLSGGISQRCDLVVDSTGLLYTVFIGQSPQLVVGQLLPQEEGYPPPFQPGGIGTPVIMPAQLPGEIRGRWRPGCGHSVNSWDIRFMSVACVPSAIVCCPICLYIQRIISPASEIYNNVTNQVIVA